MANKIVNQQNFIENGQFSGGAAVTPTSGSTFNSASFENPQFGFVAGGLYVGGIGTLVFKTADSSVLTFTNAFGYVPALVTAISASSTATSIVALK
jgi:hypothetical protein